MSAVRFSEFGEPKVVLSCQKISQPVASGKDVLVRMLACPINPSDLLHIRGEHDHRPDLPATPGLEGVGIVLSGGGMRGRLFRGKRVAVLNPVGGNWAEFVTVPATSVIPLSHQLTDELNVSKKDIQRVLDLAGLDDVVYDGHRYNVLGNELHIHECNSRFLDIK